MLDIIKKHAHHAPQTIALRGNNGGVFSYSDFLAEINHAQTLVNTTSPLALAMDIQFAPKALVRCKETRSQVGLSKQERQKNVDGAFQASAGVKGKTILVLDDVSTTGSTLSSSAEALFASGAKNVYALTVARALPYHGLKHA